MNLLGEEPVAQCQKIVEGLDIGELYKFGNSKIFFKEAAELQMEDKRSQKLNGAVTVIQRVVSYQFL